LNRPPLFLDSGLLESCFTGFCFSSSSTLSLSSSISFFGFKFERFTIVEDALTLLELSRDTLLYPLL
jgi:hypothetical protein